MLSIRCTISERDFKRQNIYNYLSCCGFCLKSEIWGCLKALKWPLNQQQHKHLRGWQFSTFIAVFDRTNKTDSRAQTFLCIH